jgi:hypothetical protein
MIQKRNSTKYTPRSLILATPLSTTLPGFQRDYRERIPGIPGRIFSEKS